MVKRFDVSIAGEINMDLVLYGLPEEMPTERELLASNFVPTLGGSSAIVAHNLAALGAKVGFVTYVGRDALGEMALQRLAASGVDTSRVAYAPSSVSSGVTILLHHGERRRILTYLGTINELSRKDLDFDYLSDAQHFHISSLFLQRALAPDLPQLCKDLKRAGLTISLDTNDDPENRWDGVLHELLPHVDILLPNRDEACRMAKRADVEEALKELANRVPCVAIKCGAMGVMVQAGSTVWHVDGVQVTPVDAIGAGDSFDAGFLAAFLRGASWEECAYQGNVAGALSTLRSGGTEAFRDAALREEFLRNHTLGTA